jgi:hypothetical protein
LVFCGACCTASKPVYYRNCPQPSLAEVNSYEALVEAAIELERLGYKHPYGEHVDWVARVVGYCFPDVTPLERNEEAE